MWEHQYGLNARSYLFYFVSRPMLTASVLSRFQDFVTVIKVVGLSTYFIKIIPNESQSVRPRCFVGAELTENTFLSDTSTATKILDKKSCQKSS